MFEGNTVQSLVHRLAGAFYRRTEMTPSLVSMPAFLGGSAISTNSWFPYSLTVYTNYIVCGWGASYVGSAPMSGSNYWTFELRDGSNVIDDFDTTAASPATTYVYRNGALNYAVDTSTPYLHINCVKTGSPGAIALWGPVLELRG